MLDKVVFATSIGENFILGVIAALMAYINYKNKRE